MVLATSLFPVGSALAMGKGRPLVRVRGFGRQSNLSPPNAGTQMSLVVVRLCAAIAALSSCVAGTVRAQTYQSPESVEYHARLDRHLVANTSGGNILARAADGSLSLFTSLPGSPYGLELLAGIVYVADSGRVDGYDADSGERVIQIPVPGASFLNGLTSNGVDTLYVSDFSLKRISVIDVGDPEQPVVGTPISTGTRTPNGLAYDRHNQRLLIATWGANAAILGLDLTTASAVPTVLVSTALGNLDGIALACDGQVIVSAWSGCGTSGGCLRAFAPPLTAGSTPVVVVNGLSNPADIDYARALGTIGVPETGANRVTLVPLPGCESSIFFSDFER